jgi:hypothetical protein
MVTSPLAFFRGAAAVMAADLASMPHTGGDSVAVAAYLGGSDAFDRAMGDFAEAYADQNEADHAELQRAIESQAIVATVGI